LNAAKTAFAAMLKSGNGAAATVAELRLRKNSDIAANTTAVSHVFELHKDKVAEYQKGNVKLFSFFVGESMKEMKGQGDQKVIRDVLNDKLKKL
jgi:aspartyl-tRNA(Asn)/glutamyl-tRNA(Gln) amidotransferase subunit B